MEKEQANQKKLKNKFLDKYKNKIIKRTEKNLELYKKASPSYIFTNKIFNHIMDFIGWILLIIALYLYLKSGRGNTLQLNCHNLPQLAEACSKGIKTGIGNFTLSNISIPRV